ncbi:MAG: hypothetical protein HOC71_05860, partial [Candidatus Latescibacteria bacterium]|nr:hypothetical protein [Candidatus Latescibacterota bacterium]
KVESFDVEVGHNSGTDSWARQEEFTRKSIPANIQNGISMNALASGEPVEPASSVLSRSMHAGSLDVVV